MLFEPHITSLECLRNFSELSLLTLVHTHLLASSCFESPTSRLAADATRSTSIVANAMLDQLLHLERVDSPQWPLVEGRNGVELLRIVHQKLLPALEVRPLTSSNYPWS